MDNSLKCYANDYKYSLYLIQENSHLSLHFTGTPAANRQTHAGSCSGFEEGLGR